MDYLELLVKMIYLSGKLRDKTPTLLATCNNCRLNKVLTALKVHRYLTLMKITMKVIVVVQYTMDIIR